MEELRLKGQFIEQLFEQTPAFKKCFISKVTDLGITSRTERFLEFLDETVFPPKALPLSEIYFKLVHYCKEQSMNVPVKHLNVARLEKKCEMEMIHFAELLVGGCVNSPKKHLFLDVIMRLDPEAKESLREIISLFMDLPHERREVSHNKYLLKRI
jgi:hypothetical protein